jgi:hypothetical protein
MDGLVARARERAGLEDLGGDSWRDGMTILVETLESTEGVIVAGKEDLYRQFVDALWNRLRVVEYLKQHPELANQQIESPLVILGLPRTGTTMASYLLDQDRVWRSLLNWEAADSVPPAGTGALRTDARCLARKAEIDALATALEEAKVPIPHWEEADGPTECTFLQNQDFKALLWEAFMPTPAYSEWLLQADMTSAYEYERSVLQILQSAAPGVWSLKMPSHALHVEALLAAFPDVRIVWAHRDPFKVTGSYLSMNQLSRGMVSAHVDLDVVVPLVLGQLKAHVVRPLQTRARVGNAQFFDLHYAALLRDPIGEMRKLYDWVGLELSPEIERSMRGWLDQNPQDRFGVRPYSLEAYGITERDLEPIFCDYLAAFDIEMEC